MEVLKHTQQERATELQKWFLNSSTFTVYDDKAYAFLTDKQIKTLTKNYEGDNLKSNNKRFREIINCFNGKNYPYIS